MLRGSEGGCGNGSGSGARLTGPVGMAAAPPPTPTPTAAAQVLDAAGPHLRQEVHPHRGQRQRAPAHHLGLVPL